MGKTRNIAGRARHGDAHNGSLEGAGEGGISSTVKNEKGEKQKSAEKGRQAVRLLRPGVRAKAEALVDHSTHRYD